VVNLQEKTSSATTAALLWECRNAQDAVHQTTLAYDSAENAGTNYPRTHESPIIILHITTSRRYEFGN
jgi:hypothetical protein